MAFHVSGLIESIKWIFFKKLNVTTTFYPHFKRIFNVNSKSFGSIHTLFLIVFPSFKGFLVRITRHIKTLSFYLYLFELNVVKYNIIFL